MKFENFEPIFGQPKVEWSTASTIPVRPFLFHVHALDPYRLRVHVSDFHSNTFAAIRTVQQLEDTRDSIGIGGSWSEFVNYVIASIRSEDVKLVLEGHSKESGVEYARLIAQKSKGMPQISIPLAKAVDDSEAMANISMELHKAFKDMHNSLVNEQVRCCELTKGISAEQEKSEAIQRQLDTILHSKRHKSQKMNNQTISDPLSVTTSQDSPDKKAVLNLGSTKSSNRVVPAYRRAKVRGVLLRDAEDDANN